MEFLHTFRKTLIVQSAVARSIAIVRVHSVVLRSQKPRTPISLAALKAQWMERVVCSDRNCAKWPVQDHVPGASCCASMSAMASALFDVRWCTFLRGKPQLAAQPFVKLCPPRKPLLRACVLAQTREMCALRRSNDRIAWLRKVRTICKKHTDLLCICCSLLVQAGVHEHESPAAGLASYFSEL